MDLQFIEDTIFLQSLPNLVKSASSFDSIKDLIKDEIKSHYDPDRPVASALNVLTPALLSSFGFGWLAWLTRIAEWVFGVNFTGIYQSIINGITSLAGSSNKITPQQSDEVVNSSVESAFNSGTINEDNADKLMTTGSLKSQIRQAKTLFLLKEAKFSSSLLSKYKDTTSNIFSKLFRWVVKVILSTVGFLAVDIAVQKITNKTPDPKQPGLLPSSKPSISVPSPKQVNLKMSDDASKFLEQHQNNQYNVWLEPNNSGSIKDQLAIWAVELYPSLKSKQSQLQSLSSFHKVLNAFLASNKNDASLIVIPEVFQSLKDVVDRFVADLPSQ